MLFIKILSAASIVLAALWLISPGGKSAELFKYAMGLFIISVIISTFKTMSINLPSLDYFKKDNTATATATAICDDITAYTIETLLEKCNIKFKKVQIITDNSNASGIDITKAYVEFYDNNDFKTASEIIEKQTGIILVDGV